jgi:hypothetical protein
MPNARMKAAQMKAKAKVAAAKNKAKSKTKSPAKKTGAPKTGFKYEKIKSTSEYKPKMVKDKNKNLKAAKPKAKKDSPAKKVVKGKIKLKSGTVIKSKENTKTGKYKETIKKKGQKKIVNKGTESPVNMSGRSYDMKMAYDKKLTPKARLHYLENERHDAPGKMKGSPYHMGHKDSAMKMGSPYEKHGSPYHKHGSPYHMGHKDSPMNKALVGKQHNLPEHLKKKIEAAPEMKGSPYHMSNELKYGGPVIDQMKSLSQAGSFKVLKHMKSKI